jgi:hypothetical protein
MAAVEIATTSAVPGAEKFQKAGKSQVLAQQSRQPFSLSDYSEINLQNQ